MVQPVCFLLLNADEYLPKSRYRTHLHRTSRRRSFSFGFASDTYEGNAYVSDIDTYELLYLNQTSCGVLGMLAPKAVGVNVMR